MSMTDWAKREIELACKREREASGVKDDEWDYGCACYKSALKAFNCLMEDGHSGMSIGFTKSILVRLIEGKPLSPITEDEESWGTECHKGGCVSYQCKRMSSLFKDVYPDGRIEYHDIDRFRCIDISSGVSYHSGLVDRIMGEQFPIVMPYSGEMWKVYCSDCLTDPKNGDFDTMAIHYAIDPTGERYEIYRYFKDAPTEAGWEEIGDVEFAARNVMANILAKQEG